MANCMKCGKELNEGAMFCDKCGTPVEQESKSTENTAVEVARETEVIPEVTENKTELTVNKKILFTVSAVVLALVLVVALCLGIHFSQSKKTASVKEPTTKSEKAVTDKKQDKKADKQEKELTEAEILRDEYFAYMQTISVDGEALVRNPDIFKDAWLDVSGEVKNILKSEKDNEFSLQIGSDYSDSEELGFVIEGTYKSTDKRYMTGDYVYGMGKFSGVDLFTYTDNSGNTNAGILKDFVFNDYDGYSLEKIKVVISAIFGKDDIDIRSEEAQGPEGPTYNFNIANESGLAIKWRFYAYGGVEMSFDNGSNWCGVSFDKNYKHFYATELRENDGIYSVKYCSLDGKEIWNRNFDCIDCKNNPWLYYSDIFTIGKKTYLLFDENLYILNKSNGKDVAKPVLMKGYYYMFRYKNFIILYSHKYDEIFALDLDGTIVWRNSLSKKIGEVTDLQIIKNELLISYTPSDFNEYTYIYQRINADTGEKINELIMERE